MLSRTPVGELIRGVIREKKLAKTDALHGFYAVELPPDPIGALSRDDESGSAVFFRGADVAHRVRHEEVLVPADEPVPLHHVFHRGFESRVRPTRGNGIGRHAVPVDDFVLGVRPGLHGRVYEDVIVVLL